MSRFICEYKEKIYKGNTYLSSVTLRAILNQLLWNLMLVDGLTPRKAVFRIVGSGGDYYQSWYSACFLIKFEMREIFLLILKRRRGEKEVVVLIDVALDPVVLPFEWAEQKHLLFEEAGEGNGIEFLTMFSTANLLKNFLQAPQPSRTGVENKQEGIKYEEGS